MVAIFRVTGLSCETHFVSFMCCSDISETRIEFRYGLYVHYQYVSGFTNKKGETLKKKSYICLSQNTKYYGKAEETQCFQNL